MYRYSVLIMAVLLVFCTSLLLEGFSPNADKRLVQAVERRDSAGVKAALRNGGNPNAVNKDGRHVLFLAALSGDAQIAQVLIQAKANIDAPAPPEGGTALMIAADQGHSDVVRLLLNVGANINAQTTKGNTALNRASRQGHLTVVGVLLKEGADPNIPDKNGQTPLMQAADEGYAPIVRSLLLSGADTNSCDYKGQTALMFAAGHGDPGIIKLLLENGANVNARNSRGATPLMVGAFQGHYQVVELLIQAGADVNASDEAGHTAKMSAAQRGHGNIISLFEKSSHNSSKSFAKRRAEHAREPSEPVKAPMNLWNPDEIKTPPVRQSETTTDPKMEDLCDACNRGGLAKIRTLVEQGVDVNSHCFMPIGMTPLTCAAQRGHYSVVEFLLQHGANIRMKDKNGHTPIFAAVRCPTGNGRPEFCAKIMELLLKSGADPNVADLLGDTPLMEAQKEGRMDKVRLLIQHGASK